MGYVMKTSLTELNKVSKEDIHKQYKNLQKVERVFRTCKQSFLEIQPVFVRRAKRTKAHVFLCMLSYLILHEIDLLTKKSKLTLTDKIYMLENIKTVNIHVDNKVVKRIPTPKDEKLELLSMLNISIPEYI